MHNLDIRDTASHSGVKLWQIAQALGIADSQLSRKLRVELSDSEKENILFIIEKLSKGED